MISSLVEFEKERKRISELTTPIMPSQIPNIAIDLPQLGKYLVSEGISFSELSEDEFQKFVIKQCCSRVNYQF